MKQYQERVVREKDELDKKIKKLQTFLQDPPENLAVYDKKLLRKQLIFMNQYSEVLTERIDRF
jgi:CHASE3 domain sensor protein